jgi:hypothetical protein
VEGATFGSYSTGWCPRSEIIDGQRRTWNVVS